MATLAFAPGPDARETAWAELNTARGHVPPFAKPGSHRDGLGYGRAGGKDCNRRLHDHDAQVRAAAAKALCDIGDPEGREMLVAVIAGERKDTPGILTNAVRNARKKFHHPEGVLVMGGQEAAGSFFPPAGMGIVAVKDAFKLRGTSGQASAAEALAKDPEPYAVTLLEWALTDDKWEVRAAAAKALGERGTMDSIPKLETAMATDKHTAVRTLAAAAIIRIGDRLGTSAAVSQ